MMRNQLYDQVTNLMANAVDVLSGRIAQPTVTTFAKGAEGYRYAEKGPLQAIVQKLARLVSFLNAARALHALGFIQEQAAITRLTDNGTRQTSAEQFYLLSA
jgi:hypothetical protein